MQKRVHGVPFTQHMMNSLAEIEKKVLNHEVMQAHFNETLMQHAGYEQRIVAVESQILKVINYTEQDKAEAPRTTGFSMCGAYGAGIAAAAQQAGTGTGTGTSSCHGCTPAEPWGSWTGTGAGGAAPPGLHGAGAPGSSGDGNSAIANILQKVIGGNGRCHCVHVEELITDMGKIKQSKEDPLFNTGWRTTPGKRDFLSDDAITINVHSKEEEPNGLHCPWS